MSPEFTVARNFVDWIYRTPVGRAHRRSARRRARARDSRRGSLRARGSEGAHPRLHRRAVAGGPDRWTDPLPRRTAGRRQDFTRPVDRARTRPEVRPHGARWRARRGRDSRTPPHVHRLDAGPHHPGDATGRSREPGDSARRSRQARPGLSAAIRRRRCSRCSIPSRTRRSTTTTSRSTTTCRRCCSSRPRTRWPEFRRRCATGWRSSASPGYLDHEKLAIARQYLLPRQIEANGLEPEEVDARARCARRRSCAATRAKQASASSSAASRAWRGSWRASEAEQLRVRASCRQSAPRI